MTTLVFVYGTLKRGLSNQRWLSGQQYLGEARTQPDYRMHDLGGYPGLVLAPGGAGAGVAIQGEVWAVDPAALGGLHQLEGVDQGEYGFAPMALQPPWRDQGVHGYLYLWPVSDCPDCGDCWRE
jgi:gamma-glutamylaminecyclotransferase